MRFQVFCLMLVIAFSANAADDGELQRLNTLLGTLNQEQQSLTQQLQILQDMRHSNGLVMPAMAQSLGVDNDYNPGQNIQGGACHLKSLLLCYDNDISLSLAAYNAGEGTVARYGNRIPPYAETRNYVVRVPNLYSRYRKTTSEY